MILATIHDTFEQPKSSKLLWVSCRDLATAHALKREVALVSSETMAKSCEYMNREVFDGVSRAGLILVKMIELVGMNRLEPLWNLKLMIESIPLPFTGIICDKFLYWFNFIIPHPLPAMLQEFGKEYDHHALLEFGEYSDGEVERLMAALDKFVKSKPEGAVKYYVCKDAKEVNRTMLFRFVVAPAFRTFAVGKGLQGLSIDYALPKSYTDYPSMPEKKYPIENRWVYSHFGCNVYHEDLTFKPEVDVEVGKYEIKHCVEDVGGKLPAEHGHGTEYPAPLSMQERWMRTDPLNIMNPGVGRTSCSKMYGKVVYGDLQTFAQTIKA
jgi:D-lactate dehydrogenase